MNPFDQRLFIGGSDEVVGYKSRRITHLISVANPGASPSKPAWFMGEHLQLWFGDVFSEADARQCQTKAPAMEDIRQGVEFFRAGWKSPDSRILVSCDYGASRSPALAYVFIADQLGLGCESDAFRTIMEIRPNAVPNKLVVQLGDAFLERRGALLKPLEQLYLRLNKEISKLFEGK